MTEHGGPGRPGTRVWIGAVATVALLAAGCCAGGRLVLTARGSGAPEPADVAAVLAEADRSLTAPFAALADDPAGYEVATTELRAAADRLDDADAPGTHSAALRDLADVTERAGGAGRPCPAATPRTVVLQSAEAERVRDLAAADPARAFGTFLPAAPKQQKRRAANGAAVRKGPGGGSGELVVRNDGNADDAVVSVVKGRRTVLSLYVRGGAKATVDGIPAGTYRLFLAAGEDWDGKRKGFTRGCSFTRFDDDFRFDGGGTRWTVTLGRTPGGNASTSGVDPADFPRG